MLNTVAKDTKMKLYKVGKLKHNNKIQSKEMKFIGRVKCLFNIG